MDINKNTAEDKKSILQKAVEEKFGSGWVRDYDDSYVYFESWVDGTGYIDFKVSYSISNLVSVTLGEDKIKVIRLTEYKDIPDTEEDMEKSLTKKLESWLDKHFGASKENTLQVIKQFQDEEMIAVEPLYISVGEVDGQGDTINSIEEMESLVKSFNEANESGILQSSLFHNHKTQSFSIVKAWVNPVECMIGESLVPEGQPIAKVKFHNEKAWELRKNGTLLGLSIGARATEVENLDE